MLLMLATGAFSTHFLTHLWKLGHGSVQLFWSVPHVGVEIYPFARDPDKTRFYTAPRMGFVSSTTITHHGRELHHTLPTFYRPARLRIGLVLLGNRPDREDNLPSSADAAR